MRRVPWYVWALGAVVLVVLLARRAGALTGAIGSPGNQSANPAAMANTPAGIIGAASNGFATIVNAFTGKGTA